MFRGAFIAFGILTAALCFGTGAQASAVACPTDPLAPAITPQALIDTEGGPTIGTLQYHNGGGLRHKEIALTFDDGPNPETTPRILDILDRHCIKATFFLVGIYAKAHPDLVREIARRGHVIGTHTFTHPDNLRRLSLKAAKSQITRGFAAARDALADAPLKDRQALAPFFRFPGLNDNKVLIAWLGRQDIAIMSCSFGADDWKPISSNQIYKRGLSAIEAEGRGILILHDTKPRTADMLSRFIVTLEKRGYTFVQLAPKPRNPTLADTSPSLRTSVP